MRLSDIYEDVEILKKLGYPDYYTKSYPKLMKKCDRLLLCKYKDMMNWYFSWGGENKSTVFFWPPERFKYLINLLACKYNILTSNGIKLNKREYSKNVVCYYMHRIDLLLWKGYLKNDLRLTQTAINMLIDLFKKFNVKAVILGNDRLFFERAVCMAAHEYGVKVAIIQHGVYIGDDLKANEIGVCSDEFWTWSQYICDSYKKAYGNGKTKVKVLGYPHKVLQDEIINKDEKKVLFIGTCYEKLNEYKYEKYKKFVRVICHTFVDLGYKFYYRPHPRETLRVVKKTYNLTGFYVSTEKDLQKDLVSANIVVGDISSVLVEAGFLDKQIIQIIWDDFSEYAASKLDYSNTNKISFYPVETFTRRLKALIDGPNKKIDNYYMYKNNKLKETLIEYVDSLIR